MVKIKVYNDRGREIFLAAGQTAPAGWYRLATVWDKVPEGTPVLLTEEAVVVERLVSEDETVLVLETATDRAAAAAKIAAKNKAVAERAAERARLIRVATQRLAEAGEAAITPQQLVDGVRGGDYRHPDAARIGAYGVAIRRMRREARETELKSWADAHGVPAGKMVAWQGAWAGHDDSFGGLAGGDYATGEEWQWEPWAVTVLDGTESVERMCAAAVKF